MLKKSGRTCWKSINNQERWSEFYSKYADDPQYAVEMKSIYNHLIEL